jgi:hypothetical protein
LPGALDDSRNEPAVHSTWIALHSDVLIMAQPGVFTSVPDLKRKLMRYIRHYNKQPKPMKWQYFDNRVESVLNQLLQSTSHHASPRESKYSVQSIPCAPRDR